MYLLSETSPDLWYGANSKSVNRIYVYVDTDFAADLPIQFVT